MKTNLTILTVLILCFVNIISLKAQYIINDDLEAEDIKTNTKRLYFGDNVNLYATGGAGLLYQSYSSNSSMIVLHDKENTRLGEMCANSNGQSFGLKDMDAKWVFLAKPATNTDLLVNGQTKLRILANGNTGIGITAPTHKLHINGNLRVGNSNDYLTYNVSGGAYKIDKVGNGNLYYYRNNNLRMSVTDEGIGINTAFVNSDSDYQLTVDGKIDIDGILMGDTNGTMKVGFFEGTSTVDEHSYLQVNGANGIVNNIGITPSAMILGIQDICDDFVMPTIDSNTALYLAPGKDAVKETTTWKIYSDSTLKKNIEPLSNSLEKLMDVKLYEYEYNGLAGTKSGKKHYGVMAQEIQEILPNTVSPIETNNKRSDGSSKEILGFNPHDLFMMHIDATKELATQMEEKNAQYEELNAKYNELEDKYDSLVMMLENIAYKANNNSIVTLPKLYQSVPNPTDGKMVIAYSVPQDSNRATISITNLEGKFLYEIVIEDKGDSQLIFDAVRAGLTKGTYIYSLLVDNIKVDSKKFLLLD